MGLPAFNLFKAIGGKPLDVLIFFVLLLLILGTDYAFAGQAQFMNGILTMYALMFLMGRVLLPKVEKKQFPIGKAIFNFVLMFMITGIIMLFVPTSLTAFLAAGAFDAQIAFAFSFGILYAFIKAYIEEDIFRNRLSVVLGEKGQAVAFGVFHFFALILLVGYTPAILIPIGILIGLGFTWGIMQNKFGTFGSTGSHFAYNAAIIGILPRMVGALV